MRRTPAVLIAVSSLALAASPSATAAPTVSGAAAAVEKRVEGQYRSWFGNGEYAYAECKKKKTTRKEVRYRCDWLILGGDSFQDGFDGVERPSGSAWAYGTRSGRARYSVVLY